MLKLEEKSLYKIKEVALELEISTKHTYKLVKDGDIKGTYLGKAIRISKEELERYIKEGSKRKILL